MGMKLKYLAASVLALSCMSAMAAEEVELKVTGTIVPAACEPTFAGGGKVDYGKIGSGRLSATDFTKLEQQSIGFTLTCNSPTTAGITFVDNRVASGTPAGIEAALGTASDGLVYGLALAGGKQVGGYLLQSDPPSLSADGKSVEHITKQLTGGAWRTPYRDGGFVKFNANYHAYHAFAAPGTLVPVPFTVLTGNVLVTAALNKAGELNLTNEVPIDGSATMQVSYY